MRQFWDSPVYKNGGGGGSLSIITRTRHLLEQSAILDFLQNITL
jgi:hypothetical protein